MKKDLRIGFRVDSKVRETLVKIAEKEHRTLSNLISKILAEYVEGLSSQGNSKESDTQP